MANKKPSNSQIDPVTGKTRSQFVQNLKMFTREEAMKRARICNATMSGALEPLPPYRGQSEKKHPSLNPFA